jgi:hypothetical protein
MKKLTIMLIALLALAATDATVMTSVPQTEAQGPTLKISKVYNLNQTGTTFMVNVTIDDVVDLGGWSISLKWDPNITGVSTGDRKGIMKRTRTGIVYYNIYEGGLMANASGTNFLLNAVDNTNGTMTSLADFFKQVGGGTQGSGVLATINFTLKNVGTTIINVTQSIVQDRSGATVDHTTLNGLITDQPPPPPPPIWTELWFQTAVILFFVVIVLPAVVIVRLRGPAKITEKDLERIRGYRDEIEGKPLSEDEKETPAKDSA